MVTEEPVSGFACPYCADFFKEESDCDAHINDWHLEQPEPKDKIIYFCDICGAEFPEESYARSCEEAHTQKEISKSLEERKRKADIARLLLAATHPAQKRLV